MVNSVHIVGEAIIPCSCSSECEDGSELVWPLKTIIDQLLQETQQYSTDVAVAKVWPRSQPVTSHDISSCSWCYLRSVLSVAW